ncbi:MAG: hypothetical protein ABW321_10710 [Polyangiales bacterium]
MDHAIEGRRPDPASGRVSARNVLDIAFTASVPAPWTTQSKAVGATYASNRSLSARNVLDIAFTASLPAPWDHAVEGCRRDLCLEPQPHRAA